MEAYKRLEKEFAEWVGLPSDGMVCVNSGTAALHVGLEALRLPPGASCACPDFTMIACARAITMAGLTPVFIDCNDGLLIDPDLLPDEGISAVMPVHIYGRRCNMDTLHAWALARGVIVIEDLAEAHGVAPHPNTDVAAWSFFKNKIISCTDGEGGAVWFRDPNHAKLARQLRTLGFTEAHDFVHTPRGHNYRMSNAHAELIRKSLYYYPGHRRMREEIEGWYGTACPSEWKMPPRQAPWVYDLCIPGLTRRKQSGVVGKLNAEGIAARMGFYPMSRQPEYAHLTKYRKVHNYTKREVCSPSGLHICDYLQSVADLASEEVFYLPICPGKTTEQDCKRAFEIIRHAIS